MNTTPDLRLGPPFPLARLPPLPLNIMYVIGTWDSNDISYLGFNRCPFDNDTPAITRARSSLLCSLDPLFYCNLIAILHSPTINSPKPHTKQEHSTALHEKYIRCTASLCRNYFPLSTLQTVTDTNRMGHRKQPIPTNKREHHDYTEQKKHPAKYR